MSEYFKDITKDIVAATFDDLLNKYESRHLELQNDYADLYHASTLPEKPKTMSLDRWHEIEAAWVPVPLLKVIVSKIASMMYGRAVDRTSGSDEIDKLLEPIWTLQKRLMPKVCKSAGLMGDGALRITPDWYSGITLRWWDGRHINPIYDPNTLEIVGMFYDVLADPLSSQVNRLLGGSGDVKDIKELVTKHIRDPLTGEILQEGIRARFVDGKPVPWDESTPPELDGLNPLGDYLDCVFWRNDDAITGIRGASDAEAIAPLLNSINEMLVQGSMVIKYNAYPVITTTAQFKKNPSVHAGKIFQLGTDGNGNPATMGYLEWSQEMKGYMDMFNRLMSLVHETSQVPAVAVGDLEHIGSLSSGRAYEVAMSPLLDLISMREEIYTQQELEVMELSIAGLAHVDRLKGLTTEQFGIANMPDAGKIKALMATATVEYAPVKVARDELSDAQVHSMRISSGYESEEQAMRATHPNWSDEKVLEELEKTGADEVKKLDAETGLRSQNISAIIEGEK
jgi:hypothetical protein